MNPARRPAPRASAKATPPVPARSLRLVAPAPYAQEELCALAEIGYHYLLSGGLVIAEAIFSGLVAIAPQEAYFHLALGLTRDRLEQTDAAAACYAEAARLEPSDGRPELNLAELAIARGDRARAKKLLSSAARKSAARGETALAAKATAMLTRLELRPEVVR